MTDDDVVSDRLTYRESALNLPVQTALFTVGPLVLGLAQIGIGLGTELPVQFAVVFAAVMALYAALMTDYNRTLYRIRVLEEAGLSRR